MPIGSHEEPARRRGRLTQLFLGVAHENLLPSRPRPLHDVLRDSSGAARLLSGTSYPLGVPRHPPNLVIMCCSEIHLFFSGANLEGFNFQCKIGQVRYCAKLKNDELPLVRDGRDRGFRRCGQRWPGTGDRVERGPGTEDRPWRRARSRASVGHSLWVGSQ